MAPPTFHQIALSPILAGLKNAHVVLTKGHQHALTTSIDPDSLLTTSLYPDMLDLRNQIFRLTDSAKRVPSHINPAIEGGATDPWDEQTFPELLERIERTIAYLEGVDASLFEGREDEEVVNRVAGGTLEVRYLAFTYVTMFAHPNFWFHATTAYDILRHKGVELHKVDFLNGANLVEVKAVAKTE